MPTATYDPAKVVVSFGGNLIGGFADGTFVMAERSEDAFTVVVGSGGEGARVFSNNKSGTVTLTLMGSSSSNDILTSIAKVDELLKTGIGPLFIKDLGGTTLVSAQNSWIKKPASIEFGKELSNREWVLECENLDLSGGGNF